jgi:hypothetical protein
MAALFENGYAALEEVRKERGLSTTTLLTSIGKKKKKKNTTFLWTPSSLEH